MFLLTFEMFVRINYKLNLRFRINYKLKLRFYIFLSNFIY